jgi:hypothetical protein
MLVRAWGVNVDRNRLDKINKDVPGNFCSQLGVIYDLLYEKYCNILPE